MSEASFASLGPTLLARKGGAKPAMRPQLAPLPELVADEQLEDLGWNDMGGDDAQNPASDTGQDNGPLNGELAANDADIVLMKPSAKRKAAVEAPIEDAQSPESTLIADPVHASQPLPSAKPAQDKKTTNTPAKADKSSRRAAFTLRLDSERHLKLRLAATLQGVSAQSLVTEALDAMLDEFEDLEALALHLNGHMNTRKKRN